MDADNVFMKILRGEIPSYTIYEDDDFKVILDRFPSALGHSLIIPKTSCESIFDLPDNVAAKVMPVAAGIARALQSATGCDGVNILQNSGESAGQTISYYHVHVIPRYAGDGVVIHWDTVDPPTDDFGEMLVRVKTALNK